MALAERFRKVAYWLSSGQVVPAAVVGLAMAIVSWPPTNLVPQPGVDGSWQAGLAMALEHHIAWGPRIDFTYGPLGFLIEPTLYFRLTSALSICYLLVSRGLLFALLLRVTSTKFPGLWAVLVTFVAGATAVALVDQADLLMACAMLIAVEALRSTAPRTQWYASLGLGVLAGAGLLIKFSVGLLAIGLAVVVVASTSKWARNGLTAAVTFVVTLVVAWVATGNSLGNFWLYLRMSAAIAGGFAGAMSLEVGRINEWYYAGILLGCLAVWLAWSLKGFDARLKACTWLAFAGYSWVALKEGFVRHDGHDLEFFGLMIVAVLALPVPRPPRLGTLAPRQAGLLGLATLFTWVAAGGVPSNVVSLSTDAHGFGSNLTTILDRAKATALIDSASASLQAGYQIPPSFLQDLRGQTVAIETYENTVAWAYTGFKWDPEPILQQYTAYESSLDNLDAKFLRSSAAPTRILAQPAVASVANGQGTYFEAPTANLAMMCRYAQVAATQNWQLLAKVPDRCGKLVLIETVHASFGEPVSVPAAPPGDAVVATFHGVGSSLLYRVENLVLKARWIQMIVPGVSYRFVAGTETDPHIMSVPAALGYSSSFAPPQISTFTLYERNILTNGGRYRVSFYALKLKPALPRVP